MAKMVVFEGYIYKGKESTERIDSLTNSTQSSIQQRGFCMDRKKIIELRRLATERNLTSTPSNAFLSLFSPYQAEKEPYIQHSLVPNMEQLSLSLDGEVDTLPTIYLGMLLGAKSKPKDIWNFV